MNLTPFILSLGLGVFPAQLSWGHLVHFENDPTLPLVNLQFIVKSGSTSDPETKQGLAHLTSELLLRGTAKKSKDVIRKELDRLGARVGAETRAEAIIFQAKVLSENLDAFLELFKEILTEPGFAAAELEPLKDETRAQLVSIQADDHSLALYWLNRVLFRGHPFGRPSTGTMSGLQAITLADIKANYEANFRDLRFLVLAQGRASSSQISRWAEQISKLRPGGSPPSKLSPVPKLSGRRLVLIDKPDRTQAAVLIAQAGIHPLDSGFNDFIVGNHAYGSDSFHSRLMKEIRVNRGWSYFATSRLSFGSVAKTWLTHFAPAIKDLEPSVKEILRMLQNIQKEGISKEEFESSVNAMIQSSGFQYDTAAKRLENALNEELYGLSKGFFRNLSSRIKGTSLKKTNQILSKYIDPENLLILIVASSDSANPGTLARAWGIDEKAIEIIPYQRDF